MRKISIQPFLLSAILLIISIFISCNHKTDTKHLNPKAFPHEESNLNPDPSVIYGRLKNDFRYILMKNKEPKDRVSMHLDVLVGSIHETDKQKGIAHFLEHMLFRGTTHFPPGELIKYFQNIGMEFGPDVNAHTGFYETVYDILLPKGDMESIEEGLLVLQDYAHGGLLLPKETFAWN